MVHFPYSYVKLPAGIPHGTKIVPSIRCHAKRFLRRHCSWRCRVHRSTCPSTINANAHVPLASHIDIGYVCICIYDCICIHLPVYPYPHPYLHSYFLIFADEYYIHLYTLYICVCVCKTNIHGIFIRYSWDIPFSTFSMSIFAQHRVDRPTEAQAPPKATPKPPASLEFWSVTWDETLELAGGFHNMAT